MNVTPSIHALKPQVRQFYVTYDVLYYIKDDNMQWNIN